MRPGAFWAVHGFSNQFWGWGGEDDDLRRRVQAAGHGIVRFPELDGHVVDVEAMTLQEKLTHLRAHPDEKCLDKWEAAAASQRVGSAADGATTVRHRVVDFHNHLLPDDHWTVVLRVEVERDQEDGGAEEG